MTLFALATFIAALLHSVGHSSSAQVGKLQQIDSGNEQVSTSITATTPAHVSGPVSVVVTNTDGQSGTLPNGYTYNAPATPPTVTAISPNSGSTTGGTSVTISGTGFSSGATVTPVAESANNTRVPPATQIVDSTGAVWTRSSSGLILRNGASTAGVGSQILYCNRIVYVFGTDSQWWRWTNGWIAVGATDPCAGPTPTPTPTPTAESANNTRVPPATQIVDSTNAVWTRSTDGAILRNGAGTAGAGSQILYCNRIVYVFGTDSQWWRWSNGWIALGTTDPCAGPTPTPTPTPTAESANNTRVPPATQIVDSTGAVWTRSSGGSILRNGASTAGAGSQILYCNLIVYVFGTDSQWYRWSNGWIAVGTTDPCAGPTPTPTPSPTPTITEPLSAQVERLDPINETGGEGENPLSRNFNWALPLLSLPGRAGMDLGLSLSYNSLIWLKSGGNTISFDDDGGFPGPGFRLGFPVIKPHYFNSQTGKNAFLLLSPDGSRTELRQVGTSTFYEAADSSYLMFDSGKMILYTSDGAQLSYSAMGSEHNCTQIKDRNGNYITIRYTTFGRIDTIIDTLGRNIKFNYDAGWLTEIIQVWNQGRPDQITHYWARFFYDDSTTIKTNFPGLTVVGTANGVKIRTLSQVKLADDSSFDFSYTTWGQVWRIRSLAPDGHVLNHRSYNLPQTADASQTDCPRFTERRDWAQYWNGDTDGTVAGSEEVLTKFAVPVSDSWTMPDGTSYIGVRAQVTAPDGTSEKLYFINAQPIIKCPPGKICLPGATFPSPWRRGVPSLVNAYDSSGVLQRQIMTTWTQDNTALSYPENPRVTERNVYDPSGNRRRTTIEYQTFTLPNGASCKLPNDVAEYAADAFTVLRRTQTSFETSATYLEHRIIGLPLLQTVSDGAGNVVAKQDFQYDLSAGHLLDQGAATQHDGAKYGVGFLARGNLVVIRQFDVTDPNNNSLTHDTRIGYNTHGSVVFKADADWHTININYADSFSDGITSRKTFAYPTTISDPDGNSSTSTYHFDFGAVTQMQTPKPNRPTYEPGPRQIFSYDVLGRLKHVGNSVNGAYSKFDYALSATRVDTYTTIQEGLGEAQSFKITDGLGRVVATATDHPGSVDRRYSGQKTVYDVMGRVINTSNPTETHAEGAPSQWDAAGDDVTGGWIYTNQSYDWKGRPRVTTNQDGTITTASYAGCGCAGGEVVTLTDEMKRQQKVYSDVLGRTWKTEVLTFPDANQNRSVYSTTVNVYNVRDQVTNIKEYAGLAPTEASSTNASASCPTGSCQETVKTFDGYARLKTRHLPEQQVDPNNPASTDHTTWTYNADNTIQSVTDARSATATYSYNKRHLKTSIDYAAPTNIPVPFDIPPTARATFAYDAVANRTSMTDGTGSKNYVYDELSRMSSETHVLTGLGAKTISYEYNLGNQLKKITDPNNLILNYVYDRSGRLSAVTGSGASVVSAFASNLQYRAWGGLKHLDYGNNRTLNATYNQRLAPASFQISGVMSKTYEYYGDNRLRFSSDQLDHRFDRFYSYDQASRLKEAFSGAEARFEGGSNDRPYRETLEFDSMGHLTNRTFIQWLSGSSQADAYTNNRHHQVGVLWQYDADGNLTRMPGTGYNYDAAGQIATVINGANPMTRGVDGDGLQVKTSETVFEPDSDIGTTTTTHYVRSTVLGGEVLTEFIPLSGYSRTFVYANGAVLAMQEENSGFRSVAWEHRDPSNATYKTSFVNNQPGDHAELDPMGTNAGTSGFSESVPDEGTLAPYPSFSRGADIGTTYSWHGIRMPADEFFQMANMLMHGPFGMIEPKLVSYTVIIEGGKKTFRPDQLPEALKLAKKWGNMTRNWLVFDAFQDPMQRDLDYDSLKILLRARDQARAQELNARAYQEFNDCYGNNEVVRAAVAQYDGEMLLRWMESFDVEHMIIETVLHNAHHVHKEYKKTGSLRRAMRLATRANIKSIATSLILGTLMSHWPEPDPELRKELFEPTKPIFKDCQDRIRKKYHFDPIPPSEFKRNPTFEMRR